MFDRVADFLLFGMAPLVFGLFLLPASTVAAERSISGEVTYRERIALPPEAFLEVQLVDVSLADAPAKVLGSQTIAPVGQVPVKFVIIFDSAEIQPGMTYALQARITVADRLWFINDMRYQVEPQADEHHALVLKMVARSDPGAETIFDAEWILQTMEGRAPLPGAPLTLLVAADGKVAGKAGCNGYFASADIHDGTIGVGAIGSTFMACQPELMEQERKFLDLLAKAVRFTASREELSLADGAGNEILRFVRSDRS